MWDVTGKDTCGEPPPVLVLNSGWVGGFPEGSEGYGARQDVGRWTRAQPAPAMPQVSTLAVPQRGREVLCTKPTVAPAPCNTPRLHLGLEHLLLHEGSDTAAFSACALDLRLPSRPGAFSLLAWSDPPRSSPPWASQPRPLCPCVDDVFAALDTELQGHGRSCLADWLVQLCLPAGTRQVPDQSV